ncbi:hypothetical protein NJB93_20910 [Brucella intermedia]|uniref:Uncharacterized protein n=1 Tax=Brucella pseudintermedia TaxID=370111 RepID=A0ABY5UI36_9HYPH|nr:penicillin acylase family protein [Ochrobactrum sp. J50]MCO7729021.1 hypothetical protein [Brucella intermedia]UWL63043.1 hypothetical protein NIK97_15940 [Brucella pseudintermedia]
MARSFDDAWAECVSLRGEKSEKWSWGRVHQLKLSHPLQSLTDAVCIS